MDEESDLLANRRRRKTTEKLTVYTNKIVICDTVTTKNIGNYIVDFFISSKKLVIEIDGSQHEIEENKTADIERDRFLNSLGITVLRYSNVYLNKNFNLVCDDILEHLEISVDELKDR